MSDLERHGSWAYPRDWKTMRDLANISWFPQITWGTVDEREITLSFYSAVPVFGPDGNYIALLHKFENITPLQHFVESGKLALFCSGPEWDHRTEVRILGNETDARFKNNLVFICDWPEEDKHLERFEVSFEDGEGNYLGTVVVEQKDGLLQQYHTVACVRDVWPSETTGFRLLPTWFEFHHLHGIEHFIIYTINVDSEVLVDAYEPYIASGVASRVHFHQEDLGGKHDLHQSQTLGDCLYRVKNHAKWAVMFDIDEFFNLKDGSIFGEPPSQHIFESPTVLQAGVPQDYLGSSWDAIVKANGMTTDQVHSISLPIHHFALAQPDQELRSVWRDPELQPSCPKFVMNVQKVNTVFQHYVTSWANNTQNLFIGKDIGVLHHYRDSKGPQFDVPNPLSQKDESMLQYVPELERSLQERFNLPDVAPFLRRMSDATKVVPTVQLSSGEEEAAWTSVCPIFDHPGIQIWSPPTTS